MECFIYPLNVLHIFTGGTAHKQPLEREGPMKKSKCDWTNALSVKSKQENQISSLSVDPVGNSVMLPIGCFSLFLRLNLTQTLANDSFSSNDQLKMIQMGGFPPGSVSSHLDSQQ